jgi:ADP-ribose pyrophosphatase YjhB (NUDIX family)
MIPQKLYDEIVASMPITGVEAMIIKNDSILLLKRCNPPAKGEWWLPGGRLRKGESFEDALRREVKEETGLAIKPVEFIGVFNRVFPERHDVALVFLCKIEDENSEVKLNDEHSEYRFFKKLPSALNPFIMDVTQESKNIKIE